MSAAADGDPQDLTLPSVPAPGSADGHDGTTPPKSSRGLALSIWVLEHAQDVVTVLIGVVLILLAVGLLASGIIYFAQNASASFSQAANILLDRALFVLILIEIVHTVVLSLQAHRLIAQPFVVVGLVAVIRRILLLLSNTKQINTAELGVLIAMVAVFVTGLIAVSRFERRSDEHDQI